MVFLPSSGCISTVDKTYREKARQEQHMNATSYIEQILEATSPESIAVRPYTYFPIF